MASTDKTNWENVVFWIVTAIFIIVLIYLFLTGRAIE